MQKSYLLLHNNQQSGPFTLEELTYKSLQAKDLIWIVGHSAGWRYPEEIEELKALVPGVVPSLSNAVPVVIQQEANNSSTISQSPAPAVVPHQERHVYVSMPAKATMTVTAPATTQEPPSLSFEERVEKMRQRVSAVEALPSVLQKEEVETKYSRSLDDIKAEYASWMHSQKNKRKQIIGVKQLSVIVMVLIAAVGCFWGARYFMNLSASDPVGLKENETPAASPIDIASKQAEPSIKRVSTNAHEGQAPNLLLHRAMQSRKDSNKSSQQKSTKQATKDQTGEESTAIAKSATSSGKGAPIDSERAASIVDKLQLNADYVRNEKQGKGVGELAVTLKNASSQKMKVVAVDVIYYTDGMKEIDRKTLYFSNLSPGQTVIRNAPAQKNAQGAYAQLGLVSSEEGNIFYASNR